MANIRLKPVLLASSAITVIIFAFLHFSEPAFLKPVTPPPPTPEQLGVILPDTEKGRAMKPPEFTPPVRTETDMNVEPPPMATPFKVKAPMKVVTDPKKLQEIMASWPTNKDHLRELAEAEKRFTKHMTDALKSEEGARIAIKDLEDCVLNAPKLASGEISEKMPKEFRDMIRQAPVQAQAGCVAYGQQIAETFPALDQEVQERLEKKASPEALDHLRKSRAIRIVFPPPGK